VAENCTRAFGRYLKTLRDRRGLSLHDVCSLSQTFPDPVNKGYLSRCENGHQKLAFSKLIPLSRIYEVPANVLVERMELDMELDRSGSPNTATMSYAELTDAGKKALNQGFHLAGYAFLRDAVLCAPEDPARPRFRDLQEQVANSLMNVATAARILGRFRFALHEYLFLDSTSGFGPSFHSVLLERISGCYRRLGNLSLAEKYADDATAEADATGDPTFLGYIYGNRARLALERSDLKLAASLYERAYRAFKKSGDRVECVQSLNNLSQCFFNMSRYRAARRALETSERISRLEQHYRCLALSLILLGEIEDIENRPAQASRHLKEAVAISRQLNDRTLRFKAEFVLLQRAVKSNDGPVARAICRRLQKLSPCISSDTDELQAFRQISVAID